MALEFQRYSPHLLSLMFFIAKWIEVTIKLLYKLKKCIQIDEASKWKH
jgi:hypothetical protein